MFWWLVVDGLYFVYGIGFVLYMFLLVELIKKCILFLDNLILILCYFELVKFILFLINCFWIEVMFCFILMWS